MKQLLLWLFLAVSITAYAQIPSYYNDVNLSQSGNNLKDELAIKVISTHTTFLSYTPGVWDALEQSDVDPTDNSKVLLIYGYDDTDGVFKTDRSRNKTMHGGFTGDWNREHVYPKSLGSPDLGTSGPGSDAHSLRPCDFQMNSSRNNRKFGTGSGNSVINPQGDFYPGDEWKGDVARMMMYMYLRYGSRCLPSNVGVGNPMASDVNMIDLFLQWNVEDPVNAFEEQRNNVLVGIQGNRNPFVDNPAFATQIWGGPQAEDKFNLGNDTEAPTIPQSLVASNTTTSATTLNWAASSDNTVVTSYEVFQNGVLIGNTPNTTYNVSGLTGNTSYTFTVAAKDAAGNTSSASSGVTITTTIGGATTELFFSEYVEGSSYNKALEIANFTGNSISLANYTIKKQTNGAGSWSTGYALTGTLANGSVYVLAHSSADAGVTSQATALTTNTAISFNGNDAVGLFKNDVLIDVIGTFGSSANFGQDVTLRRKVDITNPNTTYTTSEWDTYVTNTFSDLGTHTINGGTTPDTEAPSIPTNIVASNITETGTTLNWNAATDNVGVTAYEVYRNGTLQGSTANTTYNVTGLSVATTYTFTIRAKDAAGNASASSTGTNVTTVDLTAPSIPTNVVASNETQTTIDLNWTAATDNVAVVSYEVYNSSTLIATIASTSYQVTGLSAETSYTFSVAAKDAAGNVSSNSTTVSATTLAPVVGNPDVLFFSEYVEGTSFNKALEIANTSGNTVDLAVYSIKKQTNGAGSWSTGYALTGNLTDGSVYVIGHSSADNGITSKADVLTTNSIISFNGNDAVGLFKNDVLVDAIGTFNATTTFGSDVTLRRNVTTPNTTYTVSEWDVYDVDTFSDLGTLNGAVVAGTTVLHEGFFEAGLDGWVDGGGDCALYSGTRSYEGSSSVRIRDNSGTASSMTLNNIDVSPYDTVEVAFHFYSYSMESGEDFWLRYNDGSGWNTVKAYVSGTDFENNGFYTSIVTLDKTTYNFVSNASFRFQADASANGDHIYIDQVSIKGITSGGSARQAIVSTKDNAKTEFLYGLNENEISAEDFTIYPNPTKSQLEVRIYADATASYQIHSLLGQVVKVGTLENKTINVANLKAGIYILQINDGDEILTKKFIKR